MCDRRTIQIFHLANFNRATGSGQLQVVRSRYGWDGQREKPEQQGRDQTADQRRYTQIIDFYDCRYFYELGKPGNDEW